MFTHFLAQTFTLNFVFTQDFVHLCKTYFKLYKGKISKTNLSEFGHFFDYLCRGYVQILSITSLKAPGNHSDRFWPNNFSILLLERPKTQNSMIPGCLSPWEPLFMDLNIYQNISINIRETWKHVGTYYF